MAVGKQANVKKEEAPAVNVVQTQVKVEEAKAENTVPAQQNTAPVAEPAPAKVEEKAEPKKTCPYYTEHQISKWNEENV